MSALKRRKHKKAASQASPAEFSAPKQIGDYRVGHQIGRGGFGAVHVATHVQTSAVVAVKLISLRKMTKADLSSLQTEIELLKTLHHENIVRYIDSLQTAEFLCIVLEFVSKGSIAQMIKQIGCFSETLAVIYVTQVLRGLAYLHEQGVIHRDIKGANILLTEDGLVKLADFGVAVRDADKSNSVVGTPYWMSPEIIEMSSCGTPCDIWSLGCTVIELLTGKPPYFDLVPMTALFRIVQDERPPIPEHVSPGARDFLLECFKKEPSFRKTAKELLSHPWIVNPLTAGTAINDFVPRSMEEGSDSSQQTKPSELSSDHPSVELSRQTSLTKMLSNEARKQLSGHSLLRHHRRQADRVDEEAATTAQQESEDMVKTVELTVANTLRLFEKSAETEQLVQQRSRVVVSSANQPKAAAPLDYDVDEDWDADIGNETGKPPVRRTIALQAAGSGKQGGFASSATFAVSQHPKPKQAWTKPESAPGSLPDKLRRSHVKKPSPSDLSQIFEDDDDDLPSLQLNAHPLHVNKPRNEKQPPAAAPQRVSLAQLAESDDEESLGDVAPQVTIRKHQRARIQPQKLSSRRNMGSSAQTKPPAGTQSAARAKDSKQKFLEVGRLSLTRGMAKLLKHQETERDEDWSDIDLAKVLSFGGKSSGTAMSESSTESSQLDSINSGNINALIGSGGSGKQRALSNLEDTHALASRLHERVKRRMSVSMAADSLDDPGQEELLKAADQNGPHKDNDEYAAHQKRVIELFSRLEPDASEATVISTCRELIEHFELIPSLRRYVIHRHGVLPLLDLIRTYRTNKQPTVSMLKVLNQLINDDKRLQETLSLIGVLPAVTPFAAPCNPDDIRVQAAHFITTLCSASVVTLQMFVACGGIPTIVNLLTDSESSDVHTEAPPTIEEYEMQPQVILMRCALVAIQRIFDHLHTVPHNEFCRLFVRAGLLQALSSQLRHVFVAICSQAFKQTSHRRSSSDERPFAATLPQLMSLRSEDFKASRPSQTMQHISRATTQGKVRSRSATPSHERQNAATDSDSEDELALDMRGLVFSDSAATLDACSHSTEAQTLDIDSSITPVSEVIVPAKPLNDATEMINLLSTFSQSDTKIKAALGKAEIIQTMLRILRPVPFSLLRSEAYMPLLVRVLKTIKHTAMEPSTLPALADAGAIDTLTAFLQRATDDITALQHAGEKPSKQLTDMQNHSLHALFYLCRVNKQRQVLAVIAGILPALQTIANTPGPLKQFALSILCELPMSDDTVRGVMWRHDMAHTYTEILRVVYWGTFALNALSEWLIFDLSGKVEQVLLEEHSLRALVVAFQTAADQSLEAVSQPLFSLLQRSESLAREMSIRDEFVEDLTDKLATNDAAVIRKNLLQILEVLFAHHPNQHIFVSAHELRPLIRSIMDVDNRVIVKRMAKNLSLLFDRAYKTAAVTRAQSSGRSRS